MFEVNYLAIFVATIASMILGLVWYSVLFGRQWRALMGIDPMDKEKTEQMKKEVRALYGFTTVSAFITAYILALFFNWLGVEDAVNGAILGMFAWIGFGVAPSFINALFERKPKKLWAINEGYHFVALLFTSAVLILLK